MTTLSLDAGSSSVKCQLFKSGAAIGRAVRFVYPTDYQFPRAQVDPKRLLAAVAEAIAQTPGAKRADVIGLSVMSAAWVAMDKRGRAITPIVTHQDRRSIAEAREIERTVGRKRHLLLSGNRPIPGGIGSTTCKWFYDHEKSLMKRADLVGLLNTFLHRQMTGERVIDTSNASFSGLYETCRQGGWNDELCVAAGVSRSQLPEILESDQIGGRITPTAAREFGLTAGCPVMAGMVDTSAGIMLTGARPGQIFHICGSTDVLAAVCAKARPNERLLTRALGIGKRWTAAATLAAAGSSLDWMRTRFFRDLSDAAFHQLLRRRVKSDVHFEPYLAGERVSVEQKTAAFSNLTLATTREEMLWAVIESMAADSAARYELIRGAARKLLPLVYVSGGAGMLTDLMHDNWPKSAGRRFRHLDEAPLHGLATLTPRP